jgi:hypothetical protein
MTISSRIGHADTLRFILWVTPIDRQCCVSENSRNIRDNAACQQ